MFGGILASTPAPARAFFTINACAFVIGGSLLLGGILAFAIRGGTTQAFVAVIFGGGILAFAIRDGGGTTQAFVAVISFGGTCLRHGGILPSFVPPIGCVGGATKRADIGIFFCLNFNTVATRQRRD
jgi:hypothetical protein